MSKLPVTTTIAVLALSLAVWVAFYLLPPAIPLTSRETAVVVGVSAVVVLLAKRLIALLSRSRHR